MAIDFTAFRGCPAPRADTPVGSEPNFPGQLCLLAVFLLAGLYYFLIFIVPTPGADESTVTARAVLALGRSAEAHPTMAGAIGLGLLAPALIFRRSARGYLIRLLALLAIVWACVFFFSSHPEAQAAEAVRSMLSTERNLPETIKGK